MSDLIPSREVIILGRGQSWKDCPFDTECWAISSVLEMTGISNYHQIHKVFAFDVYRTAKNSIRTAKKYHIPVVSDRSYATEKYPMRDIVKEFGKSYFQPTASYMIAYAIFKGYQKIKLYGIDQGPQADHLLNKPFVMFWLGVATGRGVEWQLSKSSILLERMDSVVRKNLPEVMDAVIKKNLLEVRKARIIANAYR